MTQADVVLRKQLDYNCMYMASKIGDYRSIITLHSNIEPYFEAISQNINNCYNSFYS